jgi:hypothetical protein
MTESSKFYIDLDELFGLKPQLPPPSYESYIKQKMTKNEEELRIIQNYLNSDFYQKEEIKEEIQNESFENPKEEIKDELSVEYWECKMCTYYNRIYNEKCEMCEYYQDFKKMDENEKKNIDYWVCNVCTLYNSLSRDRCDVCDTQNFSKFTSKIEEDIKENKEEDKNKEEKKNRKDDKNKKENMKKCLVNNCNNCESKFAFFNKKYMCQKCKYFFCDTCSSKKITIILNGDPERVCDECYKSLTSLSYIFNRIKIG